MAPRRSSARPLLPASSVALNVNLDMVSRNDDNEIFAAGTYHDALAQADPRRRAAALRREDPVRPRSADESKAGSVEDWTDAVRPRRLPRRGVPFVYFGVADHADYHQPTDTADKVNPQFFGDVADMIVEAVVTLDRSIP